MHVRDRRWPTPVERRAYWNCLLKDHKSRQRPATQARRQRMSMASDVLLPCLSQPWHTFMRRKAGRKGAREVGSRTRPRHWVPAPTTAGQFYNHVCQSVKLQASRISCSSLRRACEHPLEGVALRVNMAVDGRLSRAPAREPFVSVGASSVHNRRTNRRSPALYIWLAPLSTSSTSSGKSRPCNLLHNSRCRCPASVVISPPLDGRVWPSRLVSSACPVSQPSFEY